jgi:hypothetical protein
MPPDVVGRSFMLCGWLLELLVFSRGGVLPGIGWPEVWARVGAAIAAANSAAVMAEMEPYFILVSSFSLRGRR